MQESEYHNLAASERTHWWYAGMAAIAADWLQQLPTPGMNSSAWLLDAGCGTGGGLQWLAQFGRPCGMDLHPLALNLANAQGCSRLVRADIRALPFATGSFGSLTSFEVLCQLPVSDNLMALREFARVLKPGGWLLLRLPAHDWLRGAHDGAVHTRHRYSKQEVQIRLQAVGLRAVRLTYVNTLLFPLAVSWRLLQRSLRSAPASDVRPVPSWINQSLRSMLSMERLWLRRFNLPIGLSVLALAQKEPA